MSGKPHVLVVDDETRVRETMEKMLASSYDVTTAADGEGALAAIQNADRRPDLVLLDVRMPGMDGYDVCKQMQDDPTTSDIPVIFVTGLDSEQDRSKAFAAGAAAYLEKPFDRNALLAAVEEHADTSTRWKEVQETGDRQPSWLLPSTFKAFKDQLLEQRQASDEQGEQAAAVGPDKIYELAHVLRMPERQLTRYLARFLSLPQVERFQSEELSLSMLPRSFCVSNEVVPLADGTVVVPNPFDWELMDTLERTLWRNERPRIALGVPEQIRELYGNDGDRAMDGSGARQFDVIALEEAAEEEEEQVAEAQILANTLLKGALAERASDLHIEPKEDGALVRYRIDGDLQDVRTITLRESARLISRLKALAGMNIAEKRKPQDGGLEVTLSDRRLRLRLATSATAHGETLIIRILEPESEPVPLEELGMTADQASDIRDLAARDQGMILVVGPTGSGKSTTIFTLLSQVDARTRSVMSVEDPVEYDIPYANQQAVNEAADVTFESLLRSAMRQDPDILFLGEVRDTFSARAVLDFASSGHLTVSTLHSSNATTSIFRLERLGVNRGAMADSMTAVIAQKLLKKLCEECRDVGPPTEDERKLLSKFTDDIPDQVAHAVGCPACRDTGYRGREGVFEVLRIDAEVGDLIRAGRGIGEIRKFSADRGDYLVSHHVLEKVRELKFPVRAAYEQVLVEEQRFHQDPTETQPERVGVPESGDPVDLSDVAMDASGEASPSGEEPRQAGRERVAATPGTSPAGRGSGAPASNGGARSGASAEVILVVDDDADSRTLVEHHLTSAGYEVVLADDGIAALMEIGEHDFDAVLSDVNMPNLDGLKLLEMMGQKGVSIPTVFLTGAEDEDLEARVLEFGASDYIRKPVRKEVLLMRLRNAIRAAPAHGGSLP